MNKIKFELKFKFDKKLYNHIFLHQNCVIRYLRFFYTICATRYQCAHLRRLATFTRKYVTKNFKKSPTLVTLVGTFNIPTYHGAQL